MRSYVIAARMAEVCGPSGSLLVLNSGSSSVKFSVFAVVGGSLSALWRGQVAALEGAAFLAGLCVLAGKLTWCARRVKRGGVGGGKPMCQGRTIENWRKGWDSNPRWACTHAGFQDRCLKPLGHPSSGAARQDAPEVRAAHSPKALTGSSSSVIANASMPKPPCLCALPA